MERLENHFVTYWIEDDILIGKYKPKTWIDLNAAKQVVGNRLKMSAGRDMLLLADTTDIEYMTREARGYYTTFEGSKEIAACAILISSEISRILGNLFLSINKPSYPSKLFTSKEKAIEWLISFKDPKGNKNSLKQYSIL